MEHEVKKEWEEAYKQGLNFWGAYLEEAKRDTKFAIGDPWDAADKAYLKGQGREALHFDKARRVRKLITGYQRKNRLSNRVDPMEGGDEKTASQLTGVSMWAAQYANGFHVLSDAFENGALISGLNMIEIYLDYQEDPLNGDIKFRRWPYNRYMLDPSFMERDLSDCGYILTRDYLSEDQVKRILPADVRDAISDIKPKGRDNKFSYYSPNVGIDGKEKYRYDQFFKKVSEQYWVMVDPQTGQMKEWGGTKERLDQYIEYLTLQFGRTPDVKIIDGYRDVVKLNVLVEGIPILEDAPNPTGLIDYNFIPIMGFWTPEHDQSKEKLQGLMRCMRDPQTEINKRRSKMLDILDSQISSGWIARKDAVVNPKHMYQSGQGKVIWIDPNTPKEIPMDNLVRQLQPAGVPAGLFQSIELFDKDILEIPGANSELMGMPDSDDIQVAGILSKMRQAQGLTILQDLFDNYRLSKKIFYTKIMKVIQNNWYPSKVQRILAEQPTQQFFDRKFGKYDCVPVEGVLTDTQKQMQFMQLGALKMMGYEIPAQSMIRNSGLVDKEELMKDMQEAAKAAEENNKLANEVQKLNISLLKSKIVENEANAREQQSQVQENRENSVLDRVRAIKEIQNMHQDGKLAGVDRTLEFLKLLNQMGKQDSRSVH